MALDKKQTKLNALKYHRSPKAQLVRFLKANPDFGYSIDKLGITKEQLQDPKYHHPFTGEFNGNFAKEEFKLLKLYRYMSPEYGAVGVGDNTREFCLSLVVETDDRLLSYQEIQQLNGTNPGFANYPILTYRGGNFCKHIWVKYLVDSQTGNFVEAPQDEQPNQPPV